MGLFERAAANGSRLVVNGTGGDDWLDVDDLAYTEAFSQGQWRLLLGMLRQHAGWESRTHALSHAMRNILVGNMTPVWKHRLRRLVPGHAINPTYLSQEQARRVRRLRSDNTAQFSSLSLRQPWQFSLWQKAAGGDALLAHETMEVLAAEAGLEIRRPYWSRRLVEFLVSLPRVVVALPGDNRTLHRSAMRGRLPQVVLERYDKAEFSCTYRNLLAEIGRVIETGELPVGKKWCEKDSLRVMLEEIRRGRAREAGWPLWPLMSCSSALARSPDGLGESDRLR